MAPHGRTPGRWHPGFPLAWLVLLVLPSSTRASTAPTPDDAFPVVLSTYTTTLIGSLPARTDNIRLAAHALDGITLDPGEMLSFNTAVGPRTLERGFQQAPVILHEMRDAQVGGGICQAASTLFDAALLAGLVVVERHRHSFAVDYVPPAHDATIVWDAKDLRLVNALEQRVRIRATVLGSTMTVRLEGEEEPRETFELEAAVIETPARAHADNLGRQIELYRIRRIDGEEVDRELVHRDVYPPALVRNTER
jgi:vancomycin resistance protein VanW